MTPKEKAQYLVDKIYQTTADMRYYNPPADTFASRYEPWDQAKQCALIAVEDILKGDHLIRTPLSFWQQVKTEIEKL